MQTISKPATATTLFGGGQTDRMQGESGQDSLFMGQGDVAFDRTDEDCFVFSGGTLGADGSGGPVIRDFDGVRLNGANGEDSFVFKSGLEVGSFAYVKGAAFSGSGDSEARFDGPRQVQIDQDGDGSADFAFQVDGLSLAGKLTPSDLLWL